MSEKEVKGLRAQVLDLKRLVSDQTNEISKWQRKAVAAEKAQAKADEKAEQVPVLEDRLKAQKVLLDRAEAEVASLQAQADRVEQILEDVAALKRLAG